MKKLIIIGIILIIATIVIVDFSRDTEISNGQILGGRGDIVTTLSASSTVVGQTIKLPNGKIRTIDIEGISNCEPTYCPSINGTQDANLSATSTGGTFLVEYATSTDVYSHSGTTSLLVLETSRTDGLSFDFLFQSTSTTNGATPPAISIAFETSNDRIDWYEHNPVNYSNVNVAAGGALTRIDRIDISASSTSLAWNTNALSGTTSAIDIKSIKIDNPIAKYLRINASISGSTTPVGVQGIAPDTLSATGTLRIQATQRFPY